MLFRSILRHLQRMLAARNGVIHIEDSDGVPMPAALRNEPWAYGYADLGRPLGYWIHPPRWWRVISGENEWRVLPIYHPVSRQHNPNLAATRAALEVFLGNP